MPKKHSRQATPVRHAKNTGKLLTRRIETETETNPHALAPWGPGTSFLSMKSGDVHILDIGEGDVVLLVHGSSGSIADWQESVAGRLAESHRVVAFDSYGFGLSERNDSFDQLPGAGRGSPPDPRYTRCISRLRSQPVHQPDKPAPPEWNL